MELDCSPASGPHTPRLLLQQQDPALQPVSFLQSGSPAVWRAPGSLSGPTARPGPAASPIGTRAVGQQTISTAMSTNVVCNVNVITKVSLSGPGIYTTIQYNIEVIEDLYSVRLIITEQIIIKIKLMKLKWFENFYYFSEKLVVTVPNDEALMNFLTSIDIGAEIPASRILLDETFARKLLLGSMQVIGSGKSLRPDWDVAGDYSVGVSRLLDKNIIHLVDNVTAVNKKDLTDAMRSLKVSGVVGGIYICFIDFYF